jgi:hypothetical protein
MGVSESMLVTVPTHSFVRTSPEPRANPCSNLAVPALYQEDRALRIKSSANLETESASKLGSSFPSAHSVYQN